MSSKDMEGGKSYGCDEGPNRHYHGSELQKHYPEISIDCESKSARRVFSSGRCSLEWNIFILH